MITIIVNHNPNKQGCKVLQHFEENWKQVEELLFNDNGEPTLDEEGKQLTFLSGLRPEIAAVPVIKQTVSGGESIKIADDKDLRVALFTLEGNKALQLNVLENQLMGILKTHR